MWCFCMGGRGIGFRHTFVSLFSVAGCFQGVGLWQSFFGNPLKTNMTMESPNVQWEIYLQMLVFPL